MARRCFIIFAIFLINTALAMAFYDSESLKLDVNIEGGFETIETGSQYNVKEITVNTSFFPKEFKSQEIISIKTEPAGVINKDRAFFVWENPKSRAYSFSIDSEVVTHDDIIEVKKKIRFPLADLSSSLNEYVRPQETIDSDDQEIIRLASKLADGKDDLYNVVFNIAEWTKKNVKYDLSTLTANVSQKASWVLKNKQGVCDEITSLFIAMCRSVGVPAKFVSGIAYTNSDLFEEEWGAHGWAEVYFPGYGWVPFDVTYGQLGYVDTTHVKMSESLDAGSSSTNYEWSGRNVELRTRKIKTTVTVLSKGAKISDFVQMTVKPLKREIDFGSYNVIEVTIRNPNDFYYATEIYLSRTNQEEIYGDESRMVMLKPYEEKRIYWVVKVSDNLENEYVYTFPIVVYTARNSSATSSFKALSQGQFFRYEDARNLLLNMEEEEVKVYSREVMQNCTISKKEMYVYEDAVVQCTVKNAGNDYLEGLKVCMGAICKNAELGISQSSDVNFSLKYPTYGIKEETVSTKNRLVSKFSYIDVVVLDRPDIEITELEYPEQVNFGDDFQLRLNLFKQSSSNPKDVNVSVRFNGRIESFYMSEMNASHRYILNMKGSFLEEGSNNILISADYADGNGYQYNTGKELIISLNKVSLLQKAEIVSYKLDIFLRSLGARNVIFAAIVSGFVFVLAVIIIFRKRT